MTESDPKSVDLAVVKGELAQRRRELRAEIRTQFSNSDDPRVMALRNRLDDTDDWAVADEMSALDIAQVSRDVRELADVEAAISRIAEGNYGVCTDCGGDIRSARLAVNPSARRCISCQEKVEAATGATPPPSL